MDQDEYPGLPQQNDQMLSHEPKVCREINSETFTTSRSTLQTSTKSSSIFNNFKEEKPFKSSKRRLAPDTGKHEDKLPRDPSIITFELPDCSPVIREDDINIDDDELPPARMLMVERVTREKKFAEPYAASDYEVERIMLSQTRENNTNYLIKWKGYDLDELTWVKKSALNCEKMLKQFDDRVAVCKKIYNSLPDQEKYLGFLDHYSKGIITPSFVEQNVFENAMVKFMQNNHFAPLLVENWTRICDVLPKNFTWIAESLFSYPAKFYIEKADAELPAAKCECGEVCNPSSCPCLKAKITAKGLIKSEYANFINECHKDCGCNRKCPSRILRRGRTFPVMLFRTSKCGWSVRTLVPIPRRRFVMEYVGLIKLYEECVNVDDQTYLFNCDLPDGSIKYVVDATEYGNESRFINHSCEGNLDAFSVLGYHSTSKITRIVFFSNRDIEAGEELTFQYWRTELDLNSIDPEEKRLCHCGAENCRKFLF
uniref:Histone-lysine N-methyltransferase n=1 Tax=Panagrolaimus sp. ES5 TaxID=591445 RepID=A0AC34GX65_9BILA